MVLEEYLLKKEYENRMTTSDYIYETIKERIMKSYYEAPVKLGEVSISKEFDVSPTPVREAFQRLASEGFLKEKPYKGVYVKKYSNREIKEAMLVAAELLSLFIQLAMEKTREDAWQELLCNLKKNIEFNKDDVVFFSGNRIWFESIIQLSKSDVVIQSFRPILAIVSPEFYVKTEDELESDYLRSLFWHLYESLKMKDIEASRRSSINIIKYLIEVRKLNDV